MSGGSFDFALLKELHAFSDLGVPKGLSIRKREAPWRLVIFVSEGEGFKDLLAKALVEGAGESRAHDMYPGHGALVWVSS